MISNLIFDIIFLGVGFYTLCTYQVRQKLLVIVLTMIVFFTLNTAVAFKLLILNLDGDANDD